jgi:hypothetical protein
MKAPPPDAKPYGWVIEYSLTKLERHVFFVANNGEKDKAYVVQRARDMHGEWKEVKL